ncbi:MAG: arabinose-5-phosphate isomerase [Thermoanaerobacteraceae bacterium]|nr:arabinose-5-phosphate isomerase [Thermoanaerobacteraceae bacterium]
MHDIKKQTERILRDEANAILGLIPKIDHNFEEAVDLIYNCRGKVVVTGVGKSGHIGKKIAASLSSLGTPSFFMHATEGVHGDLGMVDRNDVVVAISNSGETEEVLNLFPSLRIIGAKIIAMTGNPNSSLARKSDVVLNIGIEKEVDPLGLAPTSSATATLVIGDALAVVLSGLKKFSREKFGVFHPGGALGRKVLGGKDEENESAYD